MPVSRLLLFAGRRNPAQNITPALFVTRANCGKKPRGLPANAPSRRCRSKDQVRVRLACAVFKVCQRIGAWRVQVAQTNDHDLRIRNDAQVRIHAWRTAFMAVIARMVVRIDHEAKSIPSAMVLGTCGVR